MPWLTKYKFAYPIADGKLLSASLIFSFAGSCSQVQSSAVNCSQVQRLQTTNMHTAWCAEDFEYSQQTRVCSCLADLGLDNLSHAAAAFDAFF